MAQINEETLIYDLETSTTGLPDSSKDKIVIFGCYSYKLNKYLLLRNPDDIKKMLSTHKYLVGFNNQGFKEGDGYDNPILKREGYDLKYKIIIDLRNIFKERASQMKIEKGMLGDLIMSYSLKEISQIIGIVDSESGKKELDYSILNKPTWTDEEKQLIREYTIRDLEVTKKMYEWVEDYFESFKEFLPEEDVNKKVYLTVSTARLVYKIICKSMGWKEEYNTQANREDEEVIGGGYVAYPAGEKFEGDVYIMDFACLPKGTLISSIHKPHKEIRSNNFFNKKIEDLKIGDYIRAANKKVGIIDNIRIQKYNDYLIKFKLDNGKTLSCTPNHILPVIRNGQKIDVEAQYIFDTDDLITKDTFDKNNSHWKSGKIKKKCLVCLKEFEVFSSSKNKKTCSDINCVNYLKSINSSCSNLGKTKNNCKHLMKMSLERKGKKRSLKICKNIAKGTINNTLHNYSDNKYMYKGFSFKSIYEMKTAQALDRDNIKWLYQPEVFVVKRKTYTPDFYLPELDKYLEVKGLINIDTKSTTYSKFKEFTKKHPNSIIINPKDIEELSKVINIG